VPTEVKKEGLGGSKAKRPEARKSRTSRGGKKGQKETKKKGGPVCWKTRKNPDTKGPPPKKGGEFA